MYESWFIHVNSGGSDKRMKSKGNLLSKLICLSLFNTKDDLLPDSDYIISPAMLMTTVLNKLTTFLSSECLSTSTWALFTFLTCALFSRNKLRHSRFPWTHENLFHFTDFADDWTFFSSLNLSNRWLDKNKVIHMCNKMFLLGWSQLLL